jgi:hypothetical protein
MASTRTNIALVNSVLGSIGEPELSASTFATATHNARHVKRIVSEQLAELQDSLPDEHWQAYADILLHKPWVFSTASHGVTAISAADPSVVQFSFDITDPTTSPYGSTIAGAVNEKANQDLLIQMKTTGSVTDLGTYDQFQWYRVLRLITGTPPTLETKEVYLGHALYQTAFAAATAADRAAFSMVRFRYPLPSDFRDVMDVDRPFANTEVEPSSVNRINEMIARMGDTPETATHPSKYAIGYDLVEADAGGTPYTAGPHGPFIYIYPFPEKSTHYRLLYQRQPTAIDWEADPDTGSGTIDLPEPMIPQLLHRCKLLAAIEIKGSGEAAGVYRQFEKERARRDASKQMSQAGNATLAPDTKSYRGHYRAATRAGRWPGLLDIRRG